MSGWRVCLKCNKKYQAPAGRIITTKYGEVEMRPTQGDHIFVDLSTKRSTTEGLTVFGVTYRGSAHFGLYNGQWEPMRYEDGRTQVYWLHLYRPGLTVDGASTSARKKIGEELTAAVRNFAKQNPGALIDAQAAHVAEEIEKRREKIAEHEAEINKLRKEIIDLGGVS